MPAKIKRNGFANASYSHGCVKVSSKLACIKVDYKTAQSEIQRYNKTLFQTIGMVEHQSFKFTTLKLYYIDTYLTFLSF
jgi:hypothetical protein